MTLEAFQSHVAWPGVKPFYYGEAATGHGDEDGEEEDEKTEEGEEGSEEET